MKPLALLALLGVSVWITAGCGSTPVPTALPPVVTQTPWIVVVSATPGPGSEARTQPTQTPWIVVVTATSTPRAAASPSVTATRTPAPTAGAGTPTAARATATVPLQATTRPTARPTAPTRPPSSPSPTLTPVPLKFRPPLLLEPPSGVSISWKATVYVEWSPSGELAPDEYYALYLDAYRESDGAFWYGDYVLTKDTSFRAEGPFLAPFHPSRSNGRALIYWWVAVVRKTGEGPDGKPLFAAISAPSDKRFFVTESKPE